MGEADKKALEKKIKEAEKAKKKEERTQLKEAVKKEKISFFTDFKKAGFFCHAKHFQAVIHLSPPYVH